MAGKIMKRLDAENLLTGEITGHRTPSICYSFFDTKEPLYEVSLGMADIKNSQKLNQKSVYPIYSVTKTFTALAILLLEERGQINIDHPACRYLNDFPFNREITIKQLLSHSSGVPNPLPLNWIHLKEDHDSFNSQLFFKKIFAQSRMVSQPGKKFSYSNLGYVLLGRIIEEVAMMPYEKFMSDNVFDKLSLNEGEIGFSIPGGEMHVRGYQKRISFSNLLLAMLIDRQKYMDKAEGIWKPFNDFYINGTSYGGIHASARSLMAYLQQLLTSDCSLLGNEFKRKLFHEHYLNNNRPSGMCLSWFKGNLKGIPYYTHAGGGGGFYCEVRLYPSKQMGSLVMFNRTGLSDERFLDKVDQCFI